LKIFLLSNFIKKNRRGGEMFFALGGGGADMTQLIVAFRKRV